MKRVAKSVMVAVIVASLLSTGISASAATGTITVSIGTASCAYRATKPSYNARAENDSCAEVGAIVYFVSAGGSFGNTGWSVSAYAAQANKPPVVDLFQRKTRGGVLIGGAGLQFKENTL